MKKNAALINGDRIFSGLINIESGFIERVYHPSVPSDFDHPRFRSSDKNKLTSSYESTSSK